MFSQFANPEKIQEMFAACPQLERFAHEFCKEFKCQLEEVPAPTVSRSIVRVVTPEGIPAGTLTVDVRGATDKNGAYVPVYFYSSQAVRKSKGSGRSSQNTRDSTSIKSLIATVKRNNEAPTRRSLLRHFVEGIRYGFSSTLRDRRVARLNLSEEEALALVLSHLKLDTNSVNLHNDAVKEKYKQYLISLEKNVDSTSTHERFCKGSYAVCYVRDSVKPYYIVGEVSMDPKEANSTRAEDYTFHGPLKRYNTLMDCPEIAPHVPIIRAWAEGQPQLDSNNQLGLPARDVYYDAIDVASGYSSQSEPWFLIPKTSA